MSTLHIEFAVSCETNFGEQVCICGGSPLFGNWAPQKGLFLATDPKRYPLWTNITPVSLRYFRGDLGRESRSSSSCAC